VDGLPPATVEGFRLNEDSVAGLIVKTAVLEVPLNVAEMVAADVAFTPTVFTVNVALDWPAATVTVAGTEASELLLERDTTVPDGPAWPVSVTVPVDGLPPVTAEGLSVKDESPAGSMVRVDDPVPWPAEIVEVVTEFTPVVVTVKVALV
jgi:hypothetical protein